MESRVPRVRTRSSVAIRPRTIALFGAWVRASRPGPRSLPIALLPSDRLLTINAWFVAGFVVGEGTFTRHGQTGFTFAVHVGAVDARLCEELRSWFGVGHVYWYRRRKPHYDDEARFAVRRTRDLVEVIVPFMDEHLPPSYKRRQYEVWRHALLDHWEHGAKRRRPCTIEGCEAPQRAKGYCRRHYYVYVESPRRQAG